MDAQWPALPYDEWQPTCETLQIWTQIVGKVKLVLSPFLNQYWHVAFRLTARGMTTGTIPYQDGVFEVQFDFLDHRLLLHTSDGQTRVLALRPRAVADFYGDFLGLLSATGIHARINPMTCEVPNPVACDVDREHSAYESDYVRRWWRIQLQTERVLERHRSAFMGKSSPIQFFWGGFDLSHTRFSGRPAPLLQGVPRFLQLSEDQENIACGFWPGNPSSAGVTLGAPAFYAYAYPEPAGFPLAPVQPEAAYYDTRFREFILPYDAVRQAANPEETLLGFFQTTYETAATLAHWDRGALERHVAQVARS